MALTILLSCVALGVLIAAPVRKVGVKKTFLRFVVLLPIMVLTGVSIVIASILTPLVILMIVFLWLAFGAKV